MGGEHAHANARGHSAQRRGWDLRRGPRRMVLEPARRGVADQSEQLQRSELARIFSRGGHSPGHRQLRAARRGPVVRVEFIRTRKLLGAIGAHEDQSFAEDAVRRLATAASVSNTRRADSGGPLYAAAPTGAAPEVQSARLNAVRGTARGPEILMSILVLILLGLIADAAVMLYFGWGVIGADIAGAIFNHITAARLAELTMASTLVALTAAAVLLGASHATYRDTRYRRHNPI